MHHLAIYSTLLTTLVLAACATDVPEDELAEETVLDGEEGKGDSAGAFTFFTVRPDESTCVTGACSGFLIARVNRESTICGFAAPMPECHVRSIDWTKTGLPSGVYLGYEQMLRDGASIILRGDIVPSASDEGVTLAANEVWLPRSEAGVAEGVFVMAKRSGADCTRSLCAGITEVRLNANNRQSDIGVLDLAASGAEASSVEIATTKLDGIGVLVAGDRYYTGGGTSAPFRGRRANQFWTRAELPVF